MIIHVISNSQETSFQGEIVKPTIQEAYDYLKLEYRKGNIQTTSEIRVHGGTYCLAKTLSFDSDFPVTICNHDQEKVTICGGTPLSGWKVSKINGKKAYKLTLPESVTEVPFLFVDGKMATAARWPQKDFFRVTDECPGFCTNDDNCDRIHVQKGDFNPKWHDPENIRIHLLHLWIEEPLTIKSYDEETCCLTLGSSMRYVPNKGNTEYAFHNVREALSEPNEYYFDRKKHELLLIPEKDDFEAVIPSCGTLARFLPGSKWITLSGLNFMYGGTHWPLFKEEIDLSDPGFAPIRSYYWSSATYGGSTKKRSMPSYSGPQGATHVPGVLLFQRANNCTIKNCSISACAWYGVQVLDGCNNLAFLENEISGMGAGGFLIGGGNADAVKQDPTALTSRIIVKKNHIHDCSLFFHSGIGVLITHACGCLVEGNHIHDLFYSGISCGWTWGYGDTVTRENCICRNHIHDLGKGILSDMGGIYLLGIQPGTRVYENVVHDIVNRYYGGWGLYTDEGSSHIVLERNVVYDCACEGFHQHYGRENIVRYNIFAFNKAHGMAFTCDRLQNLLWPAEPHSKVINVFHNVILTDGTPAYSLNDPALLKDNKIFADCNVIYDISGKAEDFAVMRGGNIKLSLKEWQINGLDIHSYFRDPGFRNAKKRDFRLKEFSSLLDYGFDFLNDMLDRLN